MGRASPAHKHNCCDFKSNSLRETLRTRATTGAQRDVPYPFVDMARDLIHYEKEAFTICGYSLMLELCH